MNFIQYKKTVLSYLEHLGSLNAKQKMQIQMMCLKGLAKWDHPKSGQTSKKDETVWVKLRLRAQMMIVDKKLWDTFTVKCYTSQQLSDRVAVGWSLIHHNHAIRYLGWICRSCTQLHISHKNMFWISRNKRVERKKLVKVVLDPKNLHR